MLLKLDIRRETQVAIQARQELVVVMAILGLLVAAFGFSFNTWRKRYYMEGDTKILYAELTKARLEAMKRKKDFFFNQPSDNAYAYAIYEDLGTASAPDGDGKLDTAVDVDGTTKLPYAQGQLKYIISTATRRFGFDANGMAFGVNALGFHSTDTAPVLYLWLQDPKYPASTDNSNIDPDYDCLKLKSTRIHMGIWNGTTCAEK